MKWVLHDDGTFDLLADRWSVKGAYPAADGAGLRSLRISVTRAASGGTAEYRLANAVLTLQFGADETGLWLDASWHGVAGSRLPHWLRPLDHGELAGVQRLFRQGVGLGGPSGFCSLPASETLVSHGLTGLIADAFAVAVFTVDHTRFLHSARAAGHPDAPGRTFLSLAFQAEELPADNAVRFPRIHLREGQDPWTVLRAAAASIAGGMDARPPQPTSYHWCSWYYLYHNLSESLLDDYLAGFKQLAPPVPLQSVQIDAGYFPSCGDWLEANALWPSGLEHAFRRIRQAGYRPGIWVGPFMVGNRSRLFREHPDWILRGLDDKPYDVWRIYGEPKLWGYRDEEIYKLDTSHPGAMAYLRHVFTTLRQWGAEFFKTDFMVYGLQDSALVKRHAPGKTSAEYFRDVLDVIREAIGPESFWLGCIAPFAPFIGYADAMRIGGDVGASWEGGFGPRNMLQESWADQYFNDLWWQNDPDAILVRDVHNQLTADEVRALALWQGLLGGVVNTSDPLHEIAPDRLQLWRFLRPGGERPQVSLPDWGRKESVVRVAVRHYPVTGAFAVLALNLSDADVTELLDMAALTGVPRGALYAWESDGSSTALGNRAQYVTLVPRHGARLVYWSPGGAPPPPSLTLGGAKED